MRKLVITLLSILTLLTCAIGLAACGHKHTYSSQITQATCTQKGLITYTCSCGKSYTEEIPELGHDETTHVAQAPTCTGIGWVEYVTCKRSGCEYSTYQEISALNHDEQSHVGKAPTCTQFGWADYVTCSRCDYTTYKELPATGEHTWNKGVITTEPTCTKEGVKTYTCTVCTTATYTEGVPATGNHTWDKGVTTKEPTCTEEGVTTFTCLVCQTATKTEPIDKLPHVHSNAWSSNETHHWHECQCGDKAGLEKHKPSAQATATTKQTCTVCGYVIKEETGIIFNTLPVTGTSIYAKVSNTTTEFSFINEITIKGDATYVVDDNKDCSSPIVSKTVDLKVGDNLFYVMESVDNNVTLYTVIIRRKPMYQVTFNTVFGSSVESQIVEEDDFAVAPTTTRAGYTFVEWDYDFTTPITDNVFATAIWQANTDTPYAVNYHLQKLDSNDYALVLTETLPGTTDTTVTAEIKEFEHFTHNENKGNLSGNINSTGDLVLNVYYTRNSYSVITSYNITTAGTLSKAGTYTQINSSYRYEKQLTLTATTYLGYTFVGWYDGKTLACETAEFTFTVDKWVTYTATWRLNEEMAIFPFTSSTSSCTITGLYDKKVTEITIPDYVTEIGEEAFYDCVRLETVVIPDSVTTVGDQAFFNCGKLTNLTIGSAVATIGIRAFDGCVSLETVVIPDSVTTVGYAAFYNCDKLTNLTIGSSLTFIDRNTFASCDGLTDVTIPDNVELINSSAFEGCNSLTNLTIGSGLVKIMKTPFTGCNNLTNVYITDIAAWCNISIYNAPSNPLYYADNLYLNGTLVTELAIPDSATAVGSYAFSNYSNLTNVTIGSAVTSVGVSAFANCSGLKTVVIPDSVTTVGDFAFDDCGKLTNLTIGSAVRTVGEGAFYDCDSLTNVYITDITAWCKIDFNNSYSNPLYYADNLYLNETLVTELAIPDSVTAVGSFAFSNYSNLTNVTIPNTVTSIGQYAFYKCSGLKTIYIPSSVTSIGVYAFSDCTDLIIYCQATSKPSGWLNGWNASNCKIVWNCDNNDVANDGYIYATIGNLTYSIKNGEATVIKHAENIKELNILTSITYKGTIYPVTGIAPDAFRNCDTLTSVYIPSSVKRIGQYAFYGCDNLKSVSFSNTSWLYTLNSSYTNGTSISFYSSSSSYLSTNAKYLTDTYARYYFYC